jgi:sugar phosphate isomerase/epimerase
MMSSNDLSRRSFLALAAASPLLSAAGKRVPAGLEMFSVRDELAKDLEGTVRAVAKMGYEDVEFFAPYYSWTPEKAKEVRKLLDDLNIKCLSTHNGPQSFKPEGIQKAIDLNSILGARFVVLASAGPIKDLDGWKGVADTLTKASETLKSANLRAGYHNHQLEFKPIEGKRPMEVLAANTPKNVMLQLDVGTCIEAGSDPVAWIDSNPGRINCLHLKEWSPDKGYKVLFGEGVAPWKKIFDAAEKTGGVEFYLIEQEGAELPPFEACEKCLAAFKKVHG